MWSSTASLKVPADFHRQVLDFVTHLSSSTRMPDSPASRPFHVPSMSGAIEVVALDGGYHNIGVTAVSSGRFGHLLSAS